MNMLTDKFQAVLEQLKRVLFWGVVGLLLVALTVLLIKPIAITDAVNSISGLVRFLLLIVIYALVGGIGYYRLQDIRRGQQISGLVVKTPSGVLAELSVESAREQILKAVRRLKSVISANAVVKARRGRAVIALNVVMTGDDLSLPEQQNEIHNVLDKVVRKQLGLRIAESPIVRIRLDGDDVAATPDDLVEEIAKDVGEKEPEVVKPADQEREKESLIKSVGRMFFGGSSDGKPSNKPQVAAEAPQPVVVSRSETEAATDTDDEEFWEFLESTAAAKNNREVEPEPEWASAAPAEVDVPDNEESKAVIAASDMDTTLTGDTPSSALEETDTVDDVDDTGSDHNEEDDEKASSGLA